MTEAETKIGAVIESPENDERTIRKGFEAPAAVVSDFQGVAPVPLNVLRITFFGFE